MQTRIKIYQKFSNTSTKAHRKQEQRREIRLVFNSICGYNVEK